MTVTLTIEQLRAYQCDMEYWVKHAMRLETIKEFANSCDKNDPRFCKDNFAYLQERMDAWMKDNPMPKLLPKELEG